jgi:hypothetical protein
MLYSPSLNSSLKISYYFRSPVLSWSDLSVEDQNEFSDQFTEEEKEEGLFVFDDLRNELFSLGDFLIIPKGKRYHGVFGQTYFSAYFVTLSRCSTEAIVSYCYC